MSVDSIVTAARNERKAKSIRRQSNIDALREWSVAISGALAIPVGALEFVYPNFLPLVIPEPLTASLMFFAGTMMFFGPKAYRGAIYLAQRLD